METEEHEKRPLLTKDRPEKSTEKRKRVISLHIVYANGFQTMLVYFLTIPALFPYMQELIGDTNPRQLSWMIASFSASRMVFSPIFGVWLHFRRRAKEPLILSNVLLMLGSMLFCYTANFSSGREYVILASRILHGASTGSSSVLLGYLSEATTFEERATVMGRFRMIQSIGVIIAPGLQVACTFIGYPGPVDASYLHLNMYTAPMFLLTLFSVINIILYSTLFTESKVTDFVEKVDRRSYSSSEGTAAEDKEDEEPVPMSNKKTDYIAAAVCVLAHLIFYFSVAEFDSMPTVLVEDMYAIPKQETVFVVSICLVGYGIFLLVSYLLVAFGLNTYNCKERSFLCSGLILQAVGVALLIPFGSEYPKSYIVHPSSTLPPAYQVSQANSNISAATNIQSAFQTSTGLLYSNYTQNTTIGCSYDWCKSVPIIQPWQLILGHLFIILTIPAIDLSHIVLFTKVTNTKAQGIANGVLISAGALGALSSPLMLNALYMEFGPRVTFLSQFAIYATIAVFSVLSFKRLIPLAHRNKPRE